jgi:hypothetical protein
MVWTNSWPSIAGAGCGLICVGAGEEWAQKVYALRGLRGVERQVGLTWGTQWPAGSSAVAWWQERQDEVVDQSRCRVAAHNQSLHAGFAAVHHKTFMFLVEPQNQDRRFGGWRRDPGTSRSFDAGGRVAGSQGLRRENAVCGDGVAVRWRGVLHDLFALEGFVSQLKC